MSKTWRGIGWCFVGASLLTHIVTVWAYSKQPDSLAAFTVLPFWFWGGIGLLSSVFAFCFLRAPLSLIVTAVWAITLSIGMDEAKALSNFTHPRISQERQAPENRAGIIRVLTVNCATFAYGDPTEDIRKWDPDIILLQQVFPYRVKQVSEALFGGDGNYRAYRTNGIITRHEIQHEVRNPFMSNQQVTIKLPSGNQIEVINVHLTTAATDMRLWNEKSRVDHRINRDTRRKELFTCLQVLEQTSSFPNTPTILGGDFNAGATDIVHRQLTRDFDDAFSTVGRGWGNTFHRRFPILRIDHIYATRQLQPQACGVAISRNTDHRMVVADLSLRE